MSSRLSRIVVFLVVTAVIVAVAAVVVAVIGRTICSGQSRAEVQGLGPFTGSDPEIRAMGGTSDVCTARFSTPDSGTEVLNHYRRQLRAQGWRVRVQSGRHWRESSSGLQGPCAGDPACRDFGHVDATRAGRCHAITTEPQPTDRNKPDTDPQSPAALNKTGVFVASGRCDQMRD